MDALICGAVRTPVGRFGGVLAPLNAEALGGEAVKFLMNKYNVEPSLVDDVILGHCYPSAEAPAIGRVVAMRAGLPESVPGWQLDRRCGSGLQAICEAAMQVQTGAADVVIAGGAESMSNVEHYTLDMRRGKRGHVALLDRLDRARVTAGCESRFPVPGGMVETAENVRAKYRISRAEQDEFALRSHQRAVAAWESGRFGDHIVPLEVPAPRGAATVVARDEHPRADTSLEKLASLRAIRGGADAESTVTAGNASGENDAAAVCIVASPKGAELLGLRPIAALRSWAVAGVHPAMMGMGPVPATERALSRLGLALSDIDLIELNEAFAVQVLAVTKEWGLTDSDFDRLNPNGGGISIGHPVGATGARILADMLPELERRNGTWALETMCIGGGQGISAVFERLN